MGQLPQTVIDQAAAINRKLADAVTAARNDRNLSTSGRNTKIAIAYKAATDAMRGVVDSYEMNNQLTVTGLQRELFGAGTASSTDVLSQRDASDRASAVNGPDEALALIHRAHLNADRVLVKQVAARAVDGAVSDPITGPSWVPALQAYADTHGSAADLITAKINKLLELRQNGDPLSSLTNAAGIYVPRPLEVQRLTSAELDAAGDDPSGRSAFPPPATDRIGA